MFEANRSMQNFDKNNVGFKQKKSEQRPQTFVS